MNENLMNDQSGIFESLMNDDVESTSLSEINQNYGYAPNHDFDEFQESSKATRVTSADSGYAEMPLDIMNDKDEENYENVNSDLIYDVLKARGINPESIKFENENGEIESFNFNELSKEDQVALLSADEEYESEYNDDEIEAIGFLRENNMTLKELAQRIRQNTIEELQSSQEQVYTVDDFSDEELFVVDFKNKYGEDFTDEELYNELEKAKENEDLFNKKMTKLRNDYKTYEVESKEEEFRIAQEQAEQERNAYIQTVVDASRAVSDFHETVEIDDKDRESLLEYIFDTDANGVTGIQKALQDPSNLIKIAWYLQHGDNTIKEVHKYYQSEIAKLSKNNKASKPDTVIKPNQKNQHTIRHKTINDLYV